MLGKKTGVLFTISSVNFELKQGNEYRVNEAAFNTESRSSLTMNYDSERELRSLSVIYGFVY